MVTDDYWFCDKVKRELQKPIWLAPNVLLGHIGWQVVTYDNWLEVRDLPRYQELIESLKEPGEADKVMSVKALTEVDYA